MEPIASPPVDFPYYPGEPAGYAGFTDHHAMLQTITDDLVAREFEWQFKTVGFAVGFSSAVLARAGASETAQRTFRVTGATAEDAEAIGWMVRMQREGTDNASPSTSNLRSKVMKVASDMSTTGPCRAAYWSKTPESQTSEAQTQGPAETEISSERLLALRSLMQIAEQRGQHLGASVQIMPLNFNGT